MRFFLRSFACTCILHVHVLSHSTSVPYPYSHRLVFCCSRSVSGGEGPREGLVTSAPLCPQQDYHEVPAGADARVRDMCHGSLNSTEEKIKI